jgi:hypothetical protein
MGMRGRELAGGRSWCAAIDDLVAKHYAPHLGGRVSAVA